MKKYFAFAMTLILQLTLAGTMAQARDYESVANDPMHTRIYTLSNGLKVYLSQNQEQPRITAHIAVNTGSRNDPAECTGLAHYLEHLMFKGTDKYGTEDYAKEKPYLDKIKALYEEYRKLTDPAQRKAKYHEIDSVSQIAAQYNIPNEYDKAMAAMGGEGSNAFTWYDITCYTENIPANEVERWAILQSDRFQNMVMRGFHTELEAVYEEKNISLASDEEKALDALMAKLFPSHSYGTQTTIGTQDHLKNPSLVEIQKYFDKYYKPNNIAICMAGDLDYDKTMEIIEKYFGNWKAGNDIAPRKFPQQPTFTAPIDTTVVGQEKEQLMMAWRFDGAASLQIDTLTMISEILQNGSCGLIDLDVNQKMLIQSAMVGPMTLKDYSVFMFDGTPKEGQSLDEVKTILLDEIKKLKAGDFDDDLLVSIINNKKLYYLQALDDNKERVSNMVNAFINGEPWQNEVTKIDRMSKLTKADIVAFANKYFTDGYVSVEKLKGEDKNIKKIDKPEITPIPSNRDKQSQFLANLINLKVEPIQPKFVDYKKDLTKAEIEYSKTLLDKTKTKTSTKSKNGKVTTTTKSSSFTLKKGGAVLPLLYVQNKDNELFDMAYRYEFGDRADVRYNVINGYIPLLGTSTMTSEEIKKQFYKIACNYSILVNNDNITISLSGLSENMPQAMKLLEQIVNDSKADKDVYNLYVENTLKERQDAKKEQRECFSTLWEYAMHGANNDATNIVSEKDLKETDPVVFTNLLKELPQYKHTLLYYGPMTVDELSAEVKADHSIGKKLKDVPKNKEWEWTSTPTNEIIIAPYEANNIYMRMLNNEQKPMNLDKAATISLFNEYFGSGMNGLVFQELRETRGLAYNAYALYRNLSRKQDPQYWMEHIITQNDKMMDCINTFKMITDDMNQTSAAFDIAKQNMTKSLATSRVTKMNIINSYIQAQRLGIDYSMDKVMYEKLPSLTLQDLANFEQENIKGKPLHYIILGNEKELDMQSLEKVAPIKRVTLEEIFGY